MTKILSLLIMIGMLCLTSEAFAQSKTRLWNLKLGSPMSALSTDEFVNPACGMNGGPPSIKLESFFDFRRCKPETETRLREVWFIYDDEWEYIARANRDEHEIARYSANSFYSHPIITSLLVDAEGLIQGYRMITDPRAPNDIRIKAHTIAMYFKNLFSQANWNCKDEPPVEREAAIEGLFVKKTCTYSDSDQFYRVYESYRYKPGQELDDNKVDLKQIEGQFESIASLEVFHLNAIKDAPCCEAYAHP